MFQFDEDIVRVLRHELFLAYRDNEALARNLQDTQARCNELLAKVRELRAEKVNK